jgi:dolichyl-phosphate beta-glucosyltransferase
MKTRTFLYSSSFLLTITTILFTIGVTTSIWAPWFVWLTVGSLLVLVGIDWGFAPVILYYTTIRGEIEKAVEATFIDPISNEKKHFPSLVNDIPGTVSLSIIVPSFNEEKRLPRMLDETISYLERRHDTDQNFTWEIIIVDDGSKDKTVEVGLEYSKIYSTEKVRVLKLAKNHGKGGAVMKGMLRGRGKCLLMVDADGATRFPDVERLEESMKRLISVINPNGGVVVGSRHHMQESDAEHKRDGIRGFVSFVFHLLQTALVPGGIRDTQCGFKLFSRDAARVIFPRQKMWGWSFDVDLLFLASVYGFPVLECAVHWVDVPGSKLSIVLASMEMARDLVLLKILYGLGIWR